MTKVGRNDPCPCGSGKKYKRCCGSLSDTKMPAESVAPKFPSQVQTPAMGLPGQAQHLSTVFRFTPPEDQRNQIGPEGGPGEYVVTFVLSRPGYNLLPENQYSYATGLKGNSHLAMTKPAFSPPGNPDATEIRIYGRTEDGQFVFKGLPNEGGFLGKIEAIPFRADNFSDAEQKAYRALSSSLSNWSAHLDIPLQIIQIDSVQVASGNSRMSLTTPFFEIPFAVAPTAELRPEFRGYVSLYREALGSNNVVYSYLCFFKIIEGILSRRRRLAIEARDAGRSFTRPQRRIPETQEEWLPWLNAIFPIRRNWDTMSLSSIFLPESLGKKFTYVIDQILTPLRVDIAHALSEASGELTLSVDELLHTQKVNRWLPLLKCMVRRMLKDEFPTEFLSYLKEDGTIIA